MYTPLAHETAPPKTFPACPISTGNATRDRIVMVVMRERLEKLHCHGLKHKIASRMVVLKTKRQGIGGGGVGAAKLKKNVTRS